MAEIGLGAYLLDAGVLTREQLAEAQQAQVVYGGRLGTNLVELGMVDIDALAEHLAALCGVPVPPKDWVATPDPKALELVRRDVAEAQGVLALRVEGTRLHAALLDPCSQTLLGSLTRTTGRSIAPYMLPELRLRYALERHLGIARPVRLMNVAKKLETVRRSQAATHDDRPEEVRLREALGIKPLAANEDLIDESSFAELHQRLDHARERAAGGSAATAAREAGGGHPHADDELLLDDVVADAAHAPAPEAALPDDALELEALLAASPDRDAASRVALVLARRHFAAAALLVVHRGMVMGLVGDGGDLARRIGGVLVPLDADSVFARVAAKGEPFRGAPPKGALDARVLRALDRALVRELALLPIALRGRVVNLLYVDGGERPLAETALGALSALTTCMTRCYERIIRERKQSTD